MSRGSGTPDATLDAMACGLTKRTPRVHRRCAAFVGVLKWLA
jgi:hypothetical protein